MSTFKLFSCNSLDANLKAAAAKALILAEGIPLDAKVDARQTMLLTQGTASPKTGWIMIAPDGTQLRTVYEVASYLEENCWAMLD